MKLSTAPRTAAAVVAAVLALCLPGPAGAATSADGATAVARPTAAAPSSGTWAGYPYLHGIVCTAGVYTAPLASFDLGNGLSPAFVTQPVAAQSGTALTVPPFDQVGPQNTGEVSPGELGFADQAQIAGYAALLSRYANADDSTTAAVADAVLRLGQPKAAPNCDDQALATSLAQTAEQYAGPYSVSLTAPPGKARPGSTTEVSVTVRSASGVAVPAAPVTIVASAAVFGGTGTTTVRTGSGGTAVLTLSIPSNVAVNSVTVDASAAVATGLTAVTATRMLGSPPSVPAIVADAVSNANATTAVGIDRTAHPRATLTVSSSGVVVGATVVPALSVTGLSGHPARVAVTIVGPLPLTASSLCSGRSQSDFARARTAYTAQGTIGPDNGSYARNAAAFTPTKPGCYWGTAAVVTTDAPAASATATLSAPLTVIDATAHASIQHAVVAANGTDTVTLTATGLHGATAALQARISAPAAPSPTTGCTSVVYSGATNDLAISPLRSSAQPTAGSSTAPTVGASGTALPAGTFRATATIRPGGVGCYQIGGQVLVTGSGGMAVPVPITFDGSANVLAIQPTVTVDLTELSGQINGPVSVSVSMGQTYGQLAHVRLGLRRHPTSRFGCTSVIRSVTDAATSPAAIAIGPSTPLVKDYTPTTVQSASIVQTGCYVPVALLTIDANNAVLATATTTDPVDTIEVGIDTRGPANGSGANTTNGSGSSDFPAGTVVSVVVLLVLAMLIVVLLARDGRLELVEELPGPRPAPGPGTGGTEQRS